MTTEIPRLLTVPEAAERLSIGETMAYELINAGKLPCLRLGRLIRIPPEALAEWIVARTRTSSATPESLPPVLKATTSAPRRGPRPGSFTGRVPDSVMARRRGGRK